MTFACLASVSQLFEVICGDLFLGLMRMNSNGGINPIVLLGKRNGGIEFFRTRTSADRQQSRDTGRASPLEHGLTILRELREINMGVRVDQFHGWVAQALLAVRL